MIRGLALIAAALIVSFGSTVRSAHAACGPSTEVKTHDEAVFGHFATRAAARAYLARAAKVGFQGLKIEADNCGDYEVEADGADTQQQRSSFAAEARRAGFQVTFEQIADPMAFHQGQVVGVFSRFATVAAANATMWKLATVNFRYIDLVHQGAHWLVVMPQVPVKSALPIAHEVAAAGFHIQFQPGTKS